MTKRLSFIALALLLTAGFGLAATASTEGSWTGHINDGMCGAKKIDAACAKKCVEQMGGKYVFVNESDKKVFNIDPQDKVSAHAGHHVIVKGTLAGDTIKVSSIEMAPAKK